MTQLVEVTGKKLSLDDDGYLKDINQWNVRVVEELAK